jgi:two-component system chemotaxis sensor kinase CheA
MENYLELFISETEEYIRQLNKELMALESNRKNSPSILAVFRVFHTVKGMAQTMGYDELGTLAHRLEDVLGDAKTKGEIDGTVLDFLFQAADFLTAYLAAIKNKAEPPGTAGMIDLIDRIRKGETVALTAGDTQAKEISEIRIKMEKLDKLFNLANELMIAKSRLIKLSQKVQDPDLSGLSETTARLITTLQDEVMRLRMLPLATVFDFFPRWLRDEAKRQEKEVDFEVVGGEIEVDRSIIDILKELLLHLIRNALDHGIRERGRITLNAVRERDKIRISVIDNGPGIDPEIVRQAAVEQGIYSGADARLLTRHELYRLLTRPNFSTRREVSTISGRGIGLDIVDSMVTKLGGKLEIFSEMGQGSIFTVELPLSLAVVRTMVFRLDRQRFAIPLSYVQETFYAEELSFKTVYHRELFPLREEILPLVRIGEKLNCPGKAGRKSVIVVQYQDTRRGFITDEIIDEEEIVAKNIDPLLPTALYSGCSIYSDGSPILILDPRGFE